MPSSAPVAVYDLKNTIRVHAAGCQALNRRKPAHPAIEWTDEEESDARALGRHVVACRCLRAGVAQ